MRLDRLEIRLLLLTALSLLCAALAIVNLREQRAYQLPSDGVFWTATPDGVVAQAVDPQGPAQAVGIRPADVLVGLDSSAVGNPAQITRRLF